MSLFRRIHVDTDPGVDDLLALAFALGSPELRVEGITTVAGNSSLDVVTDNARRFLELAGVEIPLGRGADGPLALSSVHAEHFHGPDGRGGIALPAAEPGELPDALEVLRKSLVERGVERVVALGPLTNLARTVREDRAILQGAEIVWMGGTLSEGNVTEFAEFNCYADPEAAAVVLGSGLPVRVLGLEVARQVVARPSALSRRALGSGPLGRFAYELLEALIRSEQASGGEACAPLYDPCVVAAVAFPGLFRYRRCALSVAVVEGAERGRMTVSTEPGASPVLYADRVKGEEVVDLLLARLAAWSGDAHP